MLVTYFNYFSLSTKLENYFPMYVIYPKQWFDKFLTFRVMLYKSNIIRPLDKLYHGLDEVNRDIFQYFNPRKNFCKNRMHSFLNYCYFSLYTTSTNSLGWRKRVIFFYFIFMLREAFVPSFKVLAEHSSYLTFFGYFTYSNWK